MKFTELNTNELQCLRDAVLSDMVVKTEIIGATDKQLDSQPNISIQARLLTRKFTALNRRKTLADILAEIKQEIAIRGIKPETDTGT